MVGNVRGKWGLYLAAAAVVLLAIGLVVFFRRPATVTTTANTNNPARQTYAELYDAAWRQDQGRGDATVTATLVTPSLAAALAADPQRSERDTQIYNFTKNLPANQLAFVLTIDSVAGFFSDSQILESAQLEDTMTTSGNGWLTQAWKPIIGGQAPVNAPVAVASQAGVLIFQTDLDIAWATLKNLVLRLVDLGDQPIRQFVWAQPGLLTE